MQKAVVALMALQRGVARLGAIARYLEIQVDPAGIQLSAREAPVLKVDTELRKFGH